MTTSASGAQNTMKITLTSSVRVLRKTQGCCLPGGCYLGPAAWTLTPQALDMTRSTTRHMEHNDQLVGLLQLSQ